ncbi:hypothetical protein LSAT2_032758 [Lamellibrachia satsuma]|nr:hypothetical protein LSAT2_032758 [Lamellibrachia satsuma]
MKGNINMFLVVTTLLAVACSAANVPIDARFKMCMNVCAQNFMKCRKSCGKRPESVDVCYRKLGKCEAKCKKHFGRS